MLKRPIDSFVNYFLDVKPYHTKLLEIVEQYKFAENLDVSIKESIFFTEEWSNKPLCGGVGFGYDFDDDCGYSALSCCDLFDCIGGYGLIYDNSDLLLSKPVKDIRSANASPPLNALILDGDLRYDSYYQIDSTPNATTLKVKGNIVSAISTHSIFVIAPKNVYNVAEATSEGFYIFGNVAAQFSNNKEFVMVKSGANDDAYATVEATYNSIEDRTFVKSFRQNSTAIDVNALGQIIIDSETKNNGPHQKLDAYFDGTNTVILLNPDTPLKSLTETRHGSVVLRTGLLPNRYVWIEGNYGSGGAYEQIETKIIEVTYDYVANETTLFVDNTIETAIDALYVSGGLDALTEYNVSLRGYFFGAGFDGNQECSQPKERHLYAMISEFLQIEEIFYQEGEVVPPEELGSFFVLIETPDGGGE